MLTELNREKYMRYLEADYSNRMQEQHGEELGLFGRVGPAIKLEEGENVEGLDHFFSNQMPKLLADDSVMKQIDSEISEITQAKDNETSKAKNQKSSIDK